MLDALKIREIIPHRYPFLMVDRVIEIEPGKRAVAIKNVTINEEFFQGHYPQYPIMPGVLIIEAMAQVAGIAVLSVEEYRGRVPVFAGIDKAKFRKPVVPGDQLRIEVEILKLGRMGKAEGKAFVGDELRAEAQLLFAAADLMGSK
jgi:3-hydroxyacyl-[acyl-carrier-protein] dehydratase